MNPSRVRYVLLSIFGFGLILQVVCFINCRERMWPDEFNMLIIKLLTIYSVQLGVMIGGIFSQATTTKSDTSTLLNWTALVLVGLWNVLLIWRSVAFSIATQDSVSDLTRYLDGVGSESAFLVVGVLAYFFGSSAGDRNPLVGKADGRARQQQT
jgi:hypothetical protein